tara:strand:- start:35736 stop:37958 length:2223 start_codon:yes stop_codon:yes gene_type:complete
MMQLTSFGLLMGLCLTQGLAAQAPRPANPETNSDLEQAARDVASHPYGIIATNGAHIGLAGSLQVDFGATNVAITPLLGPDAPQSMPLTIAASQVMRGSEALHGFGERKAQLRSDDVIDFALGHGVTERFVTREDGLKHSFFFASRPAGSGDLAVRLTVQTLLACQANAHAEQLQFSAGTLGSIHIGAVVGIDRTGQRADGYMRFDGEHLDLVLPAAFVDSANYPLELDPIISGAINAGRSFSDTNPDIAYDTSNAVYLVAYESVASATDQDVWAQRITYDGVRLSNPILIASNAHRSTYPTVGNCNSLDNFLVAWEDNGSGASWDVLCRSVDAATGATSGIGQIATGTSQQTRPDVGGDSYDASPGTGLCMCVWENQGSGIESCVVRMQNDPPTADSYQFLTFPSTVADFPAITKDGRNAGIWFVTWIRANRVCVRGVDYLGNPVGNEVATGIWTDLVTRPDVDGDAASFKVVFEHHNGTLNQKSIRVMHGTWDGTALQLGNSANLAFYQQGSSTSPAISLMGSKYTASWINVNTVRVQNLELDSTQKCGSEFVVSAPNRTFHAPALASRRSGGDSTSESGLLAYQPYDTTSGSNGLDARLYATFGNNPIVPVAGAGGCGVGGSIGTSGGYFALGNHDFKVTLTGASPSAALAIFIANTTGGPVNSLCGPTCGFITPDITFTVGISGGSAELPINLSCNLSSLGWQLGAQWAVLDLQPTGCTILPDLHFSDAIRMTLGN